MNRKNKCEYTIFLYARPSFLEGLARIVDFGNVLKEYNVSSTAEKADERAICADWQAVADDIYERAICADWQAVADDIFD